jgi:hypothetical protein
MNLMNFINYPGMLVSAMKFRHSARAVESLALPLGVLVLAVFLQVGLSDRLVLGPRYLLAGLEAGLLVGITVAAGNNERSSGKIRRWLAMLLIGVITFTNIASLVLVSRYLVNGTHIDGHRLIISALAIYVTNIIMFGLWYWEMDSPGLSGGFDPGQCDDFLFPQVADLRDIQPGWKPTFLDYLYMSVTNATAFSPTDVMPLTHRAKLLMMVQSLTSFVTIALVAARAVNILS